MIPDFARSLWEQIKGASKGVRVHEQEVFKSSDVKALFDAGLIRVVRDGAIFPAVDLVLSEKGASLKQKELNA